MTRSDLSKPASEGPERRKLSESADRCGPSSQTPQLWLPLLALLPSARAPHHRTSNITTPSPIHLIDAASPQARPATLALLAATARAQAAAGLEPRVLLLGGEALGTSAAAAGLDGATRLGVPGGRAELGLPVLYRALSTLGAESVCFAWSAGTARAVRWLRPAIGRVVCVTQPPDRAMSRLVRRTLDAAAPAGARAAVLALDPVLARALAGRDSQGPLFYPEGPTPVPIEQVAAMAESTGWVRAVLRRRWGSETPSRGSREFVVALLSDPPEAADARDALLAVGVLRESLVARLADPPAVALLVHPLQRQRAVAQRTAEQVRTPVRLIQDAELAAPWRVLAGCDAALAPEPEAGGLSVAAAMAAGLCVVAPDTAGHRLRLTHERTGLLAPTAEPRRLSAECQRLIEEPALTAELGAAARRAANQWTLESWLDAAAAAMACASGLEPAVSLSPRPVVPVDA